MALHVFDGDLDDPEAVAFASALESTATSDNWLPDPEDVWVQWWGACLYIAVEVPALKAVRGFRHIASDLEVCYWPATSPRGRGVETGWGNSGHPLDSQVHHPRRSPLCVLGSAMSVEALAGLTVGWLRDQMARPLELQRWNGSGASRIVLADSGDVIARRGLFLWRGDPDITERLN